MLMTRRHLLQTGATAIGGAAFAGHAWADAPASARAVRVEAAGQCVRVSVALDRHTTARTMTLADPHRFVIDMPNTQWAMPQGAAGEGPGVGVVRRYRFAQQAGGVARLVLDLDAPANVLRQEIGARSNPNLSFDLASSAPLVAPAPRREFAGRNNTLRRTVVIDAGHGGRDPGAVGTTGVREKDVVLDAALQLRSVLESRGGQYRVVLTRDADRYVELEERVRIARAQSADLFISVHADSHARPDAAGASVYTLSERGSDRAQTMMTSQNWNLDLGATPRQGVARDVLTDLFQRETTNRSAQFAQMVIPRLGEVSPLLSNTHRNAGFFVLLAPDVPAVLIETGFLSNPTDERRLNSAREREQMAGAMARAVDDYFSATQLYAARA